LAGARATGRRIPVTITARTRSGAGVVVVQIPTAYERAAPGRSLRRIVLVFAPQKAKAAFFVVVALLIGLGAPPRGGVPRRAGSFVVRTIFFLIAPTPKARDAATGVFIAGLILFLVAAIERREAAAGILVARFVFFVVPAAPKTGQPSPAGVFIVRLVTARHGKPAPTAPWIITAPRRTLGRIGALVVVVTPSAESVHRSQHLKYSSPVGVTF
jgi:hypothetical protein